MTPEQILWQAVIERALMDAFYCGDEFTAHGKRHGRTVERDQAKAWLCGGSEHFNTVCALAGIDPSFLSQSFKAGSIDRKAFYSAQLAKNRSDKARRERLAA